MIELKPIEQAIAKYERKIKREEEIIERNQGLILEEEQKIEEAEVSKQALHSVIVQSRDEINQFIGAIKALEALKKAL